MCARLRSAAAARTRCGAGGRLVITALVLASLAFAAPASATSSATAFDCSASPVFDSSRSPTQLYELTYGAGGVVTSTAMGSTSSVTYNAIGLDPVNDLLYGSTTGQSPAELIQIDANGTQTLIQDLPGNGSSPGTRRLKRRLPRNQQRRRWTAVHLRARRRHRVGDKRPDDPERGGVLDGAHRLDVRLRLPVVDRTDHQRHRPCRSQQRRCHRDHANLRSEGELRQRLDARERRHRDEGQQHGRHLHARDLQPDGRFADGLRRRDDGEWTDVQLGRRSVLLLSPR